jgi:hypothetical protein
MWGVLVMVSMMINVNVVINNEADGC